MLVLPGPLTLPARTDSHKEAAVPVRSSRFTAVFTAAFFLFTLLVLAAVVYTGWIVALNWSATGV